MSIKRSLIDSTYLWHINRPMREERGVDEFIGLCKGMMADGVLQKTEIAFLEQWINLNPDCTDFWMIQAVYERLEDIFQDGGVSEDERQDMEQLINKVIGDITFPENPVSNLPFEEPEPDITFKKKRYSFTGVFISGSRNWCIEQIRKRGGIYKQRPPSDYLVVGSIASRDWKHTSYGTKISDAINKNPKTKLVSEEHWGKNLNRIPPRIQLSV
jgi:hypothetical protein